MATVMNISVVITGNASGLSSAVKSANTSVSSLGTSAAKTGGIMSKLGSLGVPGVAALGASVFIATKAIISMGVESERVNAQTAAGIASTGGAANVTATQVQGLANSVMAYSGISDEAVQTGENMLLTFTSIRNEVGAGNDIFNQATVALTDMATKMAGGATPSAEAMSASAIKLGKALNDPVAGMTALSRVGVQFTAAQKEQIVTMVKAGDVMGAQKAILAELTTEFGGAAKAAGSTFVGQWNILKETVGNVLETIVVAVFKIVQPLIAALMPVVAVIGQVASVIATVLVAAFNAITPLFPVFLAGVVAIGAALLAVFLPSLIATAAAAVASGIAIVAAWAPIIAIVLAIGAVVIGMVKLVQAGLSALSGGWEQMGGVMKTVLLATAPLWLPIVAAIKLVVAGAKLLWGAIQAVGKAFASAFSGVAGFIGAFVNGFTSIVSAINDAVGGIGNFVSELAKGIPVVSQIVQAVGAIGDTVKANATAAAADMRTLALTVINGASQGGAAMQDMTMQIADMKAGFDAAGQSAKFTEAMNAGLAKTDELLKSGAISAQTAERAYVAWGMSTPEAVARVTKAATAAQAAAKIVASSSQIMTGAMTRLGNAGKLTEQKLVSAFRKSAQAALQLAHNSTTVANRFTQATGMTSTQATQLVTTLQQEFGDKAPQAMAILAKSSSKNFASIARNVLKGRAGYEDFAAAVGKSTGAASQAAAGQTKLAQAGDKAAASAKKAGDAATQATGGNTKLSAAVKQVATTSVQAASGTAKLGSSAQSGSSKVAAMTSNVTKLSAELNGLPRSISIQVTVNVTKTGAALGGVVPGLAHGGSVKTPLTMVGERGPELAALPPGTRVFSHADTMGMLRSATGGEGAKPNVNVTVNLAVQNANTANADELARSISKRLADEVRRKVVTP